MTDKYDKAAAYAAYLLGRRALSESALTKKLLEKGYSEEESDYAVAKLKGYGAVDDMAYARATIASLGRRGYGFFRIRQTLSEKGVDRSTADEALEEYSPDTSKIMDFLHKKLRGDVSDRGQNQKAAAALYRRGFRYDEINSALKEYCAEIEDENFD